MSSGAQSRATSAGLLTDPRWVAIRQGLVAEGEQTVLGFIEKAITAQQEGDTRTGQECAAIGREVAWEKLHTGAWKDVAEVWRDVFTVCVLLEDEGFGSEGSEDQEVQQRAMRELDMAVLMGGPTFREDVDKAIHRRIQLLKADLPELEKRKTDLAEASTSGVHAEKRQRVDVSEFDSKEQDQTCRDLPPGSMTSQGTQIPLVELPSLDDFCSDCMCAQDEGFPVIVTHAMADWPAMHRWKDMEYLRSVAGPRTVPVEIGKHYLAEGWRQDLMPFEKFLDHYFPPASSSGKSAKLDPECSQASPSGGLPNDGDSGVGYLAQHSLFDQIPELASDIKTPEYCNLGEGTIHAVNAWLGPGGTVTPLHHDPHHNLLAQVVGRKYIRLYAPKQNTSLYPCEHHLTQNSSQVDLDNVDHELFPKFAGAPFYECILQPGEMLYIPPKWWHYVTALTSSFSVSFWWS